jgi:hypothetical protein
MERVTSAGHRVGNQAVASQCTRRRRESTKEQGGRDHARVDRSECECGMRVRAQVDIRAVPEASGTLVRRSLFCYLLEFILIQAQGRSENVREDARRDAPACTLLFADLYDHRWAGAAYGFVTAGVTGLCVGFVSSLPAAIAAGDGALVAAGIIVAANLSVIPTRMLSNRAVVGAAGNDTSRRVQVPVPASSLGALKITLPPRPRNAEH